MPTCLRRLMPQLVTIGVVLILHPGCERADEPTTTAESGAQSGQKTTTDHTDSAVLTEFRALAKELRESANPYVGQRPLQHLQKQRSFAMVSSDRQRVQWHVDLAMEHLRQGHVEDARKAIDEALAFAGRQTNINLIDLPFLMHANGLVHLRQAEVENCIKKHNAQCCIFPLEGGGIHTADAPARRAYDAFEMLLGVEPENLAARWLLNLSAMAIGNYPSAVPLEYQISPQAFESDGHCPRFVDVATPLGLDTFNLCGGAIVDDLNGDGRLDVLTSTFDIDGPLHLHINNADAGFQDASDASGAGQQLGGLNCISADYDNDGDVDVLVLRGAWLFDDGQIRNSLLQNDGHGNFRDVTNVAGLASPAFPTQTASWGDFDNDGWLDVYIGNEARPDDVGGGDFPSQLFHNNGDGTFTDIAASAGVTNDRYCKGTAAGDFNNDGLLDLYVSNIGPNRLYQNNGDGTFTDVAIATGVAGPDRSFATWFFDENQDGHLDIFVGAYEAPIDAVAADHLGLPYEAAHPALYRNNGDGTFDDAAASAGLNHAWLPMGAGFGDLNNDGWPDIYLATGDPNFESLMPNVMLQHDGLGRFLNVSKSGGFGHLQKGHGVVFADIDDDGDQDVYNQLGGFFRGDGFHNALFLNPGNEGRFLYLSLHGKTTNSAGFGTRITIELETPEGPRIIHVAPGCVSSFGSRPTRQEIGLGHATSIKNVTIDWPASGIVQTHTNLQIDSWYSITESDTHAIERSLNPTSFGLSEKVNSQ